MTKNEYLVALRAELDGLPVEDVKKSVEYYSEMIDDLLDEGLSEDEATAEIGPVKDATSQILSEISLAKIVKPRVKPKRKLTEWEITLIIIGFPVWLPLIISAVAVFLSLYVVLWSVIVSLYAASASFIGGTVGGLALTIPYVMDGNAVGAVCAVGAALVCLGLFILFIMSSREAVRGIVLLSKKILIWVKSCFVGKESAK